MTITMAMTMTMTATMTYDLDQFRGVQMYTKLEINWAECIFPF